MASKPSVYNRFRESQLILRDELALDRTILANERTLLAYLRSGVALIIAGATMIHFSRHGWFLAVGLASIPLGIVCAAIGVLRYRRFEKRIKAIRRKTGRRVGRKADSAG